MTREPSDPEAQFSFQLSPLAPEVDAAQPEPLEPDPHGRCDREAPAWPLRSEVTPRPSTTSDEGGPAEVTGEGTLPGVGAAAVAERSERCAGAASPSAEPVVKKLTMPRRPNEARGLLPRVSELKTRLRRLPLSTPPDPEHEPRAGESSFVAPEPEMDSQPVDLVRLAPSGAPPVPAALESAARELEAGSAPSPEAHAASAPLLDVTAGSVLPPDADGSSAPSPDVDAGSAPAPDVDEAADRAETPQPVARRLPPRLPASRVLHGAKLAGTVAGAALVSYLGMRALVGGSEAEATPLAVGAAPAAAASAPDRSTPQGATSSASTPPSAAAPAVSATAKPRTEELDWPAGLPSSSARGLLEVQTPGKQVIYVDGVFVGRGPVRRIPLDPGPHEVLTRDGDDERRDTATLKAGRRTRISLVEVWKEP